jgi:hypothetical protein
MGYSARVPVEVLLGKTLTKIEELPQREELIFTLDSGGRFRMFHDQDCCEHVTIEDIAGNLDDLIGSPLTMAEETTSEHDPGGWKPPEYRDDSHTWTFYKFATVKGYVTIRWYGESNGYYSESVELEVIGADPDHKRE